MIYVLSLELLRPCAYISWKQLNLSQGMESRPCICQIVLPLHWKDKNVKMQYLVVRSLTCFPWKKTINQPNKQTKKQHQIYELFKVVQGERRGYVTCNLQPCCDFAYPFFSPSDRAFPQSFGSNCRAAMYGNCWTKWALTRRRGRKSIQERDFKIGGTEGGKKGTGGQWWRKTRRNWRKRIWHAAIVFWC